ncbi:hypothetical protein [Agrococcus jejuensis]|uniref:hypothetical protein n=1 Tax=Agrococcus jejuensis TaxID=399736 RepID=UPI0011A7D594|nr:hypothetical protein [Agrococcus jejuensis]
MAMEVDLALNARRFQAGTKDAERALEDLQDVVERFTDEASDAGEEAADYFSIFSDMPGDAKREVDRLNDAVGDAEREFEDAARAAKDFGRDAEDAGDDARKGLDRAGEGLDDFKSEAASSGREAAASFSGEFDDVSDLVQEIAANAFGGFGPAGAVAGLAAAAGIGLAVAGFEAVEERQERINELAAEWATSYAESGQRVLTTTQEIAALQQVYTESYQDLQDNAAEWGVSQETAALAMIGNEAALLASRESLNARMEETNAVAAANTSAYGDVSLAQQGANQEVINGNAALTELEESYALAQEQASAYNQQLVNLATTTAGATSEVNAFGDSVYTLPDGAQIIIDAETGQASTDIENVAYQTNQLDGSTATVTAQAIVGQAETILSNLVRNRSATILAHVRTQAGVPIPF